MPNVAKIYDSRRILDVRRDNWVLERREPDQRPDQHVADERLKLQCDQETMEVPVVECFKTGSSNEPASKVCPGTDNTSLTQWRQNTPKSTSHRETVQERSILSRNKSRSCRPCKRASGEDCAAQKPHDGASRRKTRERTVRREHLVRQAQVQDSTRQFDPSINASMSASRHNDDTRANVQHTVPVGGSTSA